MLSHCALWIFALSACLTEDHPVDEAVATAQQAITEEGTATAQYPEPTWISPALQVDGNFPGGVLNFATVQQFSDFYQAFDSIDGADTYDKGSLGTSPYDAANTSSATVNYKSFEIGLFAGQILDLGTCYLHGSSFTGDTYLRIYLNGAELAFNDDACGGLGSEIFFNVPINGSYEIRMGCYSTSSCSGTVAYSVHTLGANRYIGGARTYSAASTASATTAVSTVVLSLAQGQEVDIGTCGVLGGSATGDTYLRLIDMQVGGDVEVAANDDECNSLGSRITYTVPRAGEYQIRMGCYSGTSCGGRIAYTIGPDLGIASMVPPSFVSAAAVLANRAPEPADDAIHDVDYNEYVLDLKDTLTEDDTLRKLVDPELQIIVEGKLYQLTNMGVFQVALSALPAYRAWLNANLIAINTDPSFVSIPGEVPIANHMYSVMPGVIRMFGSWGTPKGKLPTWDDDATGCPECLTTRVPGSKAAMASAGATFDFPDDETAASNASPLIGGPITNGADIQIGRIAYWNGKVNVHKTPSGAWVWDGDCVSGSNIDPTQYCRKFFPTTAFHTEVATSTKPPSVWYAAGCRDPMSGNGQREFICMGQEPTPPACNQSQPVINFANYELPSRFYESKSVGFGNRRFVLKARSTGFEHPIEQLDLTIGFRTIGFKGKLQRKRRFLGIQYWSRSTADEIILGVENMKLDTDYVVPTPQLYNTLQRPEFHKLAKYKLGKKVLDVASITINTDSPFYPLTREDLDNFLNNQLNRLIGVVYTNVWKQIEGDIVNAIDPSFGTRYAAYTKMVDAINDQHKVRWAIGEGQKSECRAHKNTWTFNSNGGFKFVQRGGVPGPPGSPPARVFYDYKMKAGSFWGRARVGSEWAGIRLVLKP